MFMNLVHKNSTYLSPDALPDPYLKDQFAKFERGDEFGLDGKYNLGILKEIYEDSKPYLTERTNDLDVNDPLKLTLTRDDLDPVFVKWHDELNAKTVPMLALTHI